jgi:hypothetical protein
VGTCLFPAGWPPRAAVLDQYVTRADFLLGGLGPQAQVRRSGKRGDLCFSQVQRRVPDGLLREVVVEIGHLARIRETDLPAGLSRVTKACSVSPYIIQTNVSDVPYYFACLVLSDCQTQTMVTQ